MRENKGENEGQQENVTEGELLVFLGSGIMIVILQIDEVILVN